MKLSIILFELENCVKIIHTPPSPSANWAHMLSLEDYVGGPLKIPTKLKDKLEKVIKLDNNSNSDLLLEFYDYLRTITFYKNY